MFMIRGVREPRFDCIPKTVSVICSILGKVTLFLVTLNAFFFRDIDSFKAGAINYPVIPLAAPLRPGSMLFDYKFLMLCIDKHREVR